MSYNNLSNRCPMGKFAESAIKWHSCGVTEMSLREAKRRATARAPGQAAFDLARERGVDGFTIDEVAARAGYLRKVLDVPRLAGSLEQRLVAMLTSAGSASMGQITAALKVPRTTAWRALSLLSAAGTVVADGPGKGRRYRLADGAEAADGARRCWRSREGRGASLASGWSRSSV